jgi:lipopolysaccharide export system permease protein
MNAEGFDFERSSESAFSRGDRELSAATMREMVDSLRSANEAARLRAVNDQPPPANRLLAPLQVKDTARAKNVEAQAIAGALDRARGAVSNIDNQMMTIKYNQDEINAKLVEIHKKYSIPFACLVFVFIGAPLGIMARKGTFGVAASMSMGFFLLYWASLIGGEKLADRGFLSPWLGMWMANIALGILGILLTARMGRETPKINWNAARRFIPSVLRTPEPAEEEAQ